MLFDRHLATMLSLYVPIVLVCLIGILVAVVKWRRHPRVSLWAILGFSISLVVPLTNLLTLYRYPHYIRGLLPPIGIAFLLVAIFGWRKSSSVEHS